MARRIRREKEGKLIKIPDSELAIYWTSVREKKGSLVVGLSKKALRSLGLAIPPTRARICLQIKAIQYEPPKRLPKPKKEPKDLDEYLKQIMEG